MTKIPKLSNKVIFILCIRSRIFQLFVIMMIMIIVWDSLRSERIMDG